MERRSWIEDGYVLPVDGARSGAKETIRRAWDTITESRIAYEEGDWTRANEYLHAALYVATEAFVRMHGCVPAYEYDFKLAKRLGRDLFSERVVDPLFDTVCVLGDMLPVNDPVSEDDIYTIRQSISAGIEYVAMTESVVLVRS